MVEKGVGQWELKIIGSRCSNELLQGKRVSGPDRGVMKSKHSCREEKIVYIHKLISLIPFCCTLDVQDSFYAGSITTNA